MGKPRNRRSTHPKPTRQLIDESNKYLNTSKLGNTRRLNNTMESLLKEQVQGYKYTISHLQGQLEETLKYNKKILEDLDTAEKRNTPQKGNKTAEHQECPNVFKGPISMEVMVCPVIAADGHFY